MRISDWSSDVCSSDLPEALREAARFSVRVESPTPGERLDSGATPIIAAASVMPALVSGFHLVYQVDERAVTAQPVDALSIALPPLDPGVHELRVVLLDAQGRELARAPKTGSTAGRESVCQSVVIT